MNQKQRIVQWLEERGAVGILNYEFPQHFILNYKARLDELRDAGYKIETIRVKNNVWKYVLATAKERKRSWQEIRKSEHMQELVDKGQGKLTLEF